MPEQLLGQSQQQRQQMVLAPQMRQSLHLLQVPVLELQSIIQQEMESNPTLEEAIRADSPLEVEPGLQPTDPNVDREFQDQFEVLAKLDDEWKEYFRQSYAAQPHTADDDARRDYLFSTLTQKISLQEHLLQQLAMTPLDEVDRKIGDLLIGGINDDGYFNSTSEETAQATGYGADRIRAVLQTIQGFDPIGVGARDVKECLLLQLNRLGKGQTPEAELVREHLQELGAKKFVEIARAMKTTPEHVHELARFIATLEPKPGRMFTAETPNYVLPEVIVKKVGDDYVVIVNSDYLPHLHISGHYRRLMEDPGTTAEVKGYIREKVQAGAFLIKSIHQRQQTIHRIATEIVTVQKDFLDKGVSELKPLTMAQVADVLGVHETTVSRALANKYMQTPRGMFELKYFFTPGYKTDEGKTISNKTIKDLIQNQIAGEDGAHPLSDNDIQAELAKAGIHVARRTVAKYRESLDILPSHLRKSF